MRIDGLPILMQQSLLAALPKEAEASAFKPGTQAEALPPAAHPLPHAEHAATSVQMLVAMAANEPEIDRRRRAAADADKGLSVLERLHAELLAGAASPERLQELVEWSEQFEAPADPQLAGLAREIELRVRVELAKLDLRA